MFDITLHLLPGTGGFCGDSTDYGGCSVWWMVSIIHVIYGTVERLRTCNTVAVLLFVHLGFCFGCIASTLNVTDA